MIIKFQVTHKYMDKGMFRLPTPPHQDQFSLLLGCFQNTTSKWSTYKSFSAIWHVMVGFFEWPPLSFDPWSRIMVLHNPGLSADFFSSFKIFPVGFPLGFYLPIVTLFQNRNPDGVDFEQLLQQFRLQPHQRHFVSQRQLQLNRQLNSHDWR